MLSGRVCFPALALLITSASAAAVQEETPAPRLPARTLEGWCSLDDPNAAGLPAPLRGLPFAERTLYRSPDAPRFLIVRRIVGVESAYDAFAADEDQLAQASELIPEADHLLETEGGEAVVLDCRWSYQEHPSVISALYLPRDDGGILGLWWVGSEPATFEDVHRELLALVPGFAVPAAPEPAEEYGSIVMGHEVRFRLALDGAVAGAEEPAQDVRLTPRAEVPAEDREFFEKVTAVNPQFDARLVGHWADAEQGVSLSYEVIAHDMGLGLREPFVQWLAWQYQAYLRADPDDGDTPVELTHLESVRTHVVGQTEVERHYANNRRAPESGVILEVFLPRSPFAEVRDLRWSGTDEESGEERHALIRIVELRSYPRSRSETILRSSNLLLILRARSAAELARLERGLDLRTRPLGGEASFTATQ